MGYGEFFKFFNMVDVEIMGIEAYSRCAGAVDERISPTQTAVAAIHLYTQCVGIYPDWILPVVPAVDTAHEEAYGAVGGGIPEHCRRDIVFSRPVAVDTHIEGHAACGVGARNNAVV